MVRRITLALLWGSGFTALSSLALNLPYVNLGALFVLTPGGLIHDTLLKQSDSAPAILLANFLVYSAFAFVIISSFSILRPARTEDRRVSLWIVFPVAVLVCLACIPTLDPLWPTGMAQLAKKEVQLQEILPLGMDLEQARGVLRSQGISFWERVQESDDDLLTRPDASVSAVAGDRIVVSHIPTDAGQFPCGYRIDVILVFGKEGLLKQRYIHRFRICL